MALPLVDGIFPALIMAGALTTKAGGLSVTGILETGLLIFGGSATVAVILAEMDGTRREQLTSILILGAILIPIAVAEAAVAETIETVLKFETFHRFAGLVILAVAAKTASSKVGEYLPSPSIIIGFGLVASLNPSGFDFVVNPSMTRLVSAGSAAGVGVGFAGAIALFAPRLRGNVDINLFRFGSSVALGMLALDVLGLMPTKAPVALGVLGVTALFAFDPDSDEDVDVPDGGDVAAPEGPAANGAVADGGDDIAQSAAYDATEIEAYEDADADSNDLPDAGLAQDDEESASKPGYGYPGEEDSRAPWL
ncbi:hypothetical protein C440_13334 [Haloferax mucosum ATCC BAA-1512]|uniref:Uncharacterized protein n=1 Tax=Haloferax mucosum ATCC BAA-1512 TaxID=662479 RepID=M0I774_9EURY|nr:DUF5794 domain-containing protein [Haloferax mucosum]ELZ91299.1 hypothetical protein C440_13334 [Haloferax mucosum ATCC BAA-1512]